MSERAAQLRDTARRLLDEGTVQVVIGYDGDGRPLFARDASAADRLDFGSRSLRNLTVYLKRKEVRALGNIAVVVKGCDERSLVVLEREAQVERAALYVIGVACDGVGAPKCAGCAVRTPHFADEVIGTASEAAPGARKGSAPELPAAQAERWAFWRREFERCTKCYACRQICPLCYCERCVVDKNRPTVIDTSPTPKGNFAWHITRAFHLAGRCTGCGECTRVCPAGIPLGLLNRSLAEAAATEFGYHAGMEPAAGPLFGAWSPADKEDFIR